MPSVLAQPASFVASSASREDIDGLLRRLDRMAATEGSEQAFYATVLNELVETAGAVAGAIWKVAGNGRSDLMHEVRLATVLPAGCAGPPAAPLSLLHAICRDNRAQCVRPGAESPGERDWNNPFLSILVAVPIRFQTGSRVLGLFVSDHPHAAECPSSVRLMEAVAEICQDFERNLRLRELEIREADEQRWEPLADRLHGSLDLRQTCFCLANDGRQFLGCDRVSVAVRRGERFRIEAVSGMDSFDRRSPSVRLLEILARRAAVSGAALWSDRLAEDTPPELVEPLEGYRDESHVRSIGVLPLRSGAAPDGDDGAVIGMLLVEQFTEPLAGDARRRGLTLARRAGTALANAVEHRSLPLLFVSQAVRRCLRAWTGAGVPRSAAAAAAGLAVLGCLVFVNSEFTVEARGSAVPRLRREIFAPADGVVVNVAVVHGQHVGPGQELLQLRDAELDYELQRVLGERQTAQQRLAAVETLRLDSGGIRAGDPLHRTAADEEELKELVKSLEQQYAILKSRRKQLGVLSPIGGEVVTWDVRQLLETRPVRRGQALMTVADTSGAWILELEVPEREVAHVRLAWEPGRTLEADYVLATNPRALLRGRVQDIAPAVRVSAEGRRTVSVRVATSLGAAEATPGVTAVAKIHCGRRSLGYVWFRDLIEAVQGLWSP